MRAFVISLVVLALSAGAAVAQAPQVGSSSAVQIAQAGMIEGEVRKVDTSAGKITIRHGPIPQYDMSTPMTMVFPVSKPDLMNGLAAGDKVLFSVIKDGGSLTVTDIRKAN
jgi:Cu/Ag efflux protein CusF